MNNKEKYKEICESGEYAIPLFLQYWWMETVCEGKQWDVALAYDGERIAAAMPFHYVDRFGLRFVVQPQLTQFSGPVYFYPHGISESHRLDFEKQVADSLLHQIDDLHPHFFLQNFSPDVTNWLPYYWTGYRQITRYTYRIGDIRDPQRVFDGFDPEKRQRKIRRYENVTSVRFDMSPRDFADFHTRYWKGKGKRDVLDKRLIERVCVAAVERGQGVVAALYDENGSLLSARFAVYDSHCAYSLMSAHDNALHKNGHSETLFWELIKFLSDKTVVFDFEGSMDPGIEHFYRSFGTKQTPFSVIYKYRFPLLAKLIGLKNL